MNDEHSASTANGNAESTSLNERIRTLRGMLSHIDPERSWVDDLIAERRQEALREEKDDM